MRLYNYKILLIVLLINLCICSAYAQNGLRSDFLNNKTVICSVNIRNFNSKDINGNDIIDQNEESGNFLNAIERLDEIKSLNINVLHLLPITPTGKLKALGTAGSLYAISDFTKINPQLVDLTSDIPAMEQAKLFINECHNRGIRVIVDLPSCGAYDLFLDHPELFIKNKKQLSVVPTDWTDVRLFNTGNNEKINEDLLNMHKAFVDMVIKLNADGIRADVATIKPFNFWKEIISYTRSFNPEFLFLAEASDTWREPPSKYAEFTPHDKLLEAGFDGYYGSFFNLKDWKTAKEFNQNMKSNKKLLSSFGEPKSVILSFTTHDEVSPVVLKDENFSVMMSWLYATLPYNPYFVDGFQYGDSYLYKWANTKASISETDDDIYFAHRGQFDIFNFSRKPKGDSLYIQQNFKNAMEFRKNNLDLISAFPYTPVKCDKEKVVAYSIGKDCDLIIVLANLDFGNTVKHVKLKISGIKKDTKFQVIKGNGYYKTKKNKLITDLSPGEIKVLRIGKFSL